MARLPQITFGSGSVESLGRMDISAYSAQANAQSRLAGALISGLGDTYVQYVHNRDNFEAQEAAVSIANKRTEWITKELAKPEYPVEEVRSYIDSANEAGFSISTTEQQVTDSGDLQEVDRAVVPGYMVHPFMYKSYMEQQTTAALAKVSSPQLRHKLETQYQDEINNDYTRFLSQTVTKQTAYMRDRTFQNIVDSLDSMNYSTAKFIVKNSSWLSSDEKDKQVSLIDERQETDNYEQMRAERNLPSLKQAVSFLRLPEEVYRAKGGALEPRERRMYEMNLRTTIDAIERADKQKQTAILSVVKSRANQAIALNYEGRSVSPRIIDNLRKQLVNAGDPVSMRKAEELMISTEFASTFDMIAGVGEAEGEKIIDQAISVAQQHLDPLDVESLKVKLQQANLKKTQAVSDDAIAYARDRLGLPAFDTKDLSNSLAILRQVGSMVHTAFGVPEQYLSKTDWIQFKGMYDAAPEDKKLSIAYTVSEELGPDTYKFYQDGLKKGAGVMTEVGSLLHEHQELAARYVIRGADALKNKLVDLTKVQKDLDAEIRETIQRAYPDSVVYAQKVEAIKDVYAALLSEQVGATPQDSLDTDILRKAISYISKGLVEYNGHIIEAPQRGATDHSFQLTMDRLSYMHFDQQGEFLNYTGKTIKKGLNDGDLHLLSVGNGKYAILDEINHPVKTKNDKVFILDLTGDLFTIQKEEAYTKMKDIEKYGDKAPAKLRSDQLSEQMRALYEIKF